MADSTETTPSRGRGRPKAWADKTEQNTIKSLDRAIEVLSRLGDLEEATLSAVADAVPAAAEALAQASGAAVARASARRCTRSASRSACHRRDPASTNDPVLIGVLGAGNAF